MKPSVRRLVVLAAALSGPALGQDAAGLNTITRVEVKSGVVEITGTRKPSFSTFPMSDPPRLVVDISEAVFKGVPEVLDVTSGRVVAIKTASYGNDASAIARVVIGYDREVEPDIQAVGNKLVVRAQAAPAGTAVASAATPATRSASKLSDDAADSTAGAAAAQKQQANAAAAAAAAEQKRQADAAATAAAAAAAAEQKRQADAAAAAAEQKRQADLAAAAAAEQKRQAEAAAAAAAAEQKRQAEAAAAAAAAAEQERQAEAAAAAEQKRQAEAAAAAAEQKRQTELAAAAAAASVEQKRQAEAAAAAAAAEQKRQAEAAAAAAAAEQKRQAEAAAVAERKRQAEAEAAAAAAEQKRQAEAAATSAAEERRDLVAARTAEAERRRDLSLAQASPAPAAQGKRSPRTSESRPAGGSPGEGSGKRQALTFVGFDDKGSRVYVRTSGPVRYTVTAGAKNTVVLELDNTSIPLRNNTRALDMAYFAGPVLRVDPERGPGHTVRVAITLRDAVAYQTRQDGNEVSVLFARTP